MAEGNGLLNRRRGNSTASSNLAPSAIFSSKSFKHPIKKQLPEKFQAKINIFGAEIRKRLNEFQNIKAESIFYEFCFCILTPQSSAKNAIEVQKKLTSQDFLNKPFDPTEILFNKNHYIRFHNQKAKRLLNARDYFPRLENILGSEISKFEKRKIIKDEFSGIGMKEASHFLRNIGFKNLAIIDRHILRNLEFCGVCQNTVPPKNEKQYLEIEKLFYNYSLEIGIEMDFLDLLFFANSTGQVLK